MLMQEVKHDLLIPLGIVVIAQTVTRLGEGMTRDHRGISVIDLLTHRHRDEVIALTVDNQDGNGRFLHFLSGGGRIDIEVTVDMRRRPYKRPREFGIQLDLAADMLDDILRRVERTIRYDTLYALDYSTG